MTALLIAASVGLAVAAISPRRRHLDPFLATAGPEATIPLAPIKARAGLVIGGVVGVVIAATAGGSVGSLVIVAAVSAPFVGAILSRRRTKTRAARIDQELPTVTDSLALYVLAGESVATAVHRVCTEGSGLAISMLSDTLTDVDDGLEAALRRAAASSPSTEAQRLFELLAHAHRTGGRLAEALIALAEDFRSTLEHRLTAEGGRRSLAVYAPILGLMVPVTLVFLMYPTLAGLTALSNP